MRLLLVDDDPLETRLLTATLGRERSIQVDIASSGQEALERLERGSPDAVLTDLVMPTLDGIELVRRIRARDASLPVIILTAHATLERAIEGIRAGATEFVLKPIDPTTLLAMVERAVHERQIPRDEGTSSNRAASSIAQVVLGTHHRLDEVRRLAERIARIPTARLLITGESGTGKSLLARAIHAASGATGDFVEVNCAALPASLLESELFGHEKGAFTDAKVLKRGLVELAQNGTLFLDEIGALPLELQAKLLLFLERQEIRRIGGAHPIAIRTRVIAATNDDLRQRVRANTFRSDLFYRLDVAAIEMPPLRQMPAVIPELAKRVALELAAELSLPVPRLTDASFAPLLDYPWPGNVRQLRNTVERALIYHDGGPFEVSPPSGDTLPLAGTGGVQLEFGLTLEEVERRYLGATLSLDRQRELGEIARGLGISRKTLWEKRRRYGLHEKDPGIS
jgi:two-component system response regulator PilR (NtrC family)/two-component system response regulator HydG